MQQDIVISNPPLKGKLHIRIVEHRNLVINQHSRPYCVVQFDKCDWVTREPTLSIWNQEATFDVISHSNELAISLWDRADESFIGIMKIRPPSDSGKLYDNFFLLSPTKAELRIQLLYRAISQKPLSSADFELLNLVGKGSFGKVWQVRKKDTKRIYAMKVCPRRIIIPGFFRSRS